jgi:periplasmic protein TonB
MFETVAPEIAGRRSRKVFYETLPLSLGLHGVVIMAAMVGTIWNTDFPKQSPKMYQAYQLVAAPPPPPPPPPPPAPKRTVVEPVRVQPVPAEVRNMAPTIIPDLIPDLSKPEPAPVPTEGLDAGVDQGVTGGEVGGVDGGQVGGVLNGTPESVAIEPPPQRDVVTVERDEPLPMRPISQEFPSYPDDARTRGWEDSLVVRYVIDKNGRVREVITLSPPNRKLFEYEAHKAIRHWRFTPFVEHGEAKEVVHELTVNFKIVRRR